MARVLAFARSSPSRLVLGGFAILVFYVRRRIRKRSLLPTAQQQPALVLSSPKALPPLPAREAPPLCDLGVGEVLLGAGSFGQVVVALHASEWAVKLYSKATVIRLKQEANLKSAMDLGPRLRHTHIMRMEPFGAQDTLHLYSIVERCSCDLFVALRKARRFDDALVQMCGAQIASAVEHLSALGIAHRNIKPEAILLSGSGALKLGSFAFLKRTANGEKMFTLCGTPEYLAPEVLTSKGHDTRVDLWCLGILLFEMLHGDPPFCAEDPMDIYQKILAGAFTFADHVSEGAKGLIKRMLVLDPTARLKASALLCAESWLPASSVGAGIPQLRVTDETKTASSWERSTAPLGLEDPFASDPLFAERIVFVT